MKISSSTRVVVIGDQTALDRLEPEFGEGVRQHIALTAPDVLLAPYDRETAKGFQQLAELERLYASLRNKLFVRLLVVNLIPEVVSRLPKPPLEQILEDWKEIQHRKKALLNESAEDGVRYVTILVTEDGDWLMDHQEALGALSGELGPSADHSSVSSAKRHRCYLMTRILELGRGEARHARDVWPVLVANLIEYLHRRSQQDNRRLLDDHGLYAWRTVRFVPDVGESVLRHRMAEAFTRVNRELLEASEGPLFGAPLQKSPPSVVEFAEPTNIAKSRGEIETTAWNLIGTRVDGPGHDARDSQFPAHSILPAGAWAASISAFARQSRLEIHEQRRQQHDVEEGALKDRVASAEAVPGKLFPGSLPPFGQVNDRLVSEAFGRIAQARTAAQLQGQKLVGYWRSHAQAARTFVALPERLLLGGAVAVALAYVAIVASVALGELTAAGSASGWVAGVVFAACGALGALGIVVLSHAVQRARGETALQEHLKPAAAQFVDKQRQATAEMARLLHDSASSDHLRTRQAARLTLHHRLARIERVLQSELQPLGIADVRGDEPGRGAQGPSGETSWGELVECKVKGPATDSNRAEELLRKLVDNAVAQFQSDWKALRTDDAHGIGLIPVPRLLRLCEEHSDRLRGSMLNQLRGDSLQSWSELSGRQKGNELDDAMKDALERSEVKKLEANVRFLSVDLHHKVAPRRHVEAIPAFKNFFKDLDDNIDDLSAEEAGTDVLAVCHLEFKINLEASGMPDSRLLRFVGEGGRSSDSRLNDSQSGVAEGEAHG